MTILWDQSRMHQRSSVVKAYLAKHPEIVTEDFPGYAPESYHRMVWYGYRILAAVAALGIAALGLLIFGR